MNQKTIQALNQLNQKFYAQVADSFSDSRNSAWEGWIKLTSLIRPLTINHRPLKILDLGCGNGRFAEFLSTQFPEAQFEYYGVDNNPKLLSLAQIKLKNLKNIRFNFEQLDIVQALLANSLTEDLQLMTYDLIVGFGVMHHIPSFELRLKLLQNLSSIQHSPFTIIMTFWQFDQSARMMSKVVEPTRLGINPQDLEANDYILDWQRGETAYRYCHSFTNQEIEQLSKLSNLEIIDSFSADGKENLNKYMVLQRI